MQIAELLPKLEEAWEHLYLFHPCSGQVSGEKWLESLANGFDQLFKNPSEQTLISSIRALCLITEDPLTFVRPFASPPEPIRNVDITINVKELIDSDIYNEVKNSIQADNFCSIYFRLDNSDISSEIILDLLAELTNKIIEPVPTFDRMMTGWAEMPNPVYNHGRLFQQLRSVRGNAKAAKKKLKLFLDLNTYSLLEPYLLALREDFEIILSRAGTPKVNFATFPITVEFELILRTTSPEAKYYPIISSWIEYATQKTESNTNAQSSSQGRLMASLIKTKMVLSRFWPLLDGRRDSLLLIEKFKDSILDKDTLEPLSTFKKISVSMRDGHSCAYIDYPNDDLWTPPIASQWSGEDLLVNFIDPLLSTETGISIDDKILSINGKTPAEIFKELEETRNYSTKLGLRAEASAMGLMIAGEKGTFVDINIQGQTHKLLRCESIYSFNHIRWRPKVYWFDNKIVYINAQNIDDTIEVTDILDNPSLKGVILDLRGYPRIWVLQSFLDKYGIGAATSLNYQIPILRGLTFDFSGTTNIRRKSKLNKKVIGKAPNICAVVDGFTFSQGEEAAWAIRELFGGKLFGEQTGGCDGNLTEIHLLERIKLRFTGMAVMTPNGLDINRNGIIPDEIIQSYYQGKDLLSDRIINHALDYVRTTILE